MRNSRHNHVKARMRLSVGPSGKGPIFKTYSLRKRMASPLMVDTVGKVLISSERAIRPTLLGPYNHNRRSQSGQSTALNQELGSRDLDRRLPSPSELIHSVRGFAVNPAFSCEKYISAFSLFKTIRVIGRNSNSRLNLSTHVRYSSTQALGNIRIGCSFPYVSELQTHSMGLEAKMP